MTLRPMSVLAVVMLAAVLPARADPDRSLDAAIRLGISPEALTASGCSVSDTSALLGRLHDHATDVEGMFALAADLDTKVRAWSEACAQLKADPHNTTLAAAVETAASQMASAKSALSSAQTAVLAIATDGMSTEQLARLGLCLANRGRRVPPGLWVATCTESGWTDVEKAVVVARRAERMGQSVPSTASSVLSSVQSQSAVIDAQYRLEHNLAEIRAAFVPLQ